ncbi:AP-5 complex subunit zeta-1 isoform X2 [Erinaceus europaeus]|uniref:AP-5 complex subunit zeta-1 isoform X2 n=1 Tax=Erinaceus europaeus TaxID=9365 RepID=A0A1S3WDW4_ERIEU|nr:AP-5 complex subunit zeta-1 isoform X2 [Erinaceus europaeus]
MAAERLLQQAREVTPAELRALCARVSSLLREAADGPDALDGLRRLFLVVSATKYPRTLEPPLPEQLWASLGTAHPEPLRLLCAAVLRELPPAGPARDPQDAWQLSLEASVLLAQGDRRGQVDALGRHVFSLLGGRHPEGPGLRRLLPVVCRASSLAPRCLKKDQTDLLSKRLADWLRYASVQQGAAVSSGGFFTPRARQPGPVTELDGVVATEFFTVLSTGQRFTDDQWLNVQAFSMLRAWLLLCGPGAPDAASGSLRTPRERLRETAFEYCRRLLEQSGRCALRKADVELQKACLAEALLVLDVLCAQDSSFLYRSLSCLKGLQARLCGDPAWVRTLLPLAHFLLSHGDAAALDAGAVCQHLLQWVPAELYHSPLLAFELLRFCRDHARLLGAPLALNFPSLLKLLAWNSPPLTAEFAALLPVLVDANTAPEMLQALLDLPCLAAALDLQLRSQPTVSERPLWDTSLKVPGCLDAFRDPQLHGLFQHLLRTRAGGRPQRLSPLFQPLQPMARCPRVVQCTQAVPVLLQAFFSAVMPLANGTLARELAQLLLERSDSLFQVPHYPAAVHRVLGQQLLALCRVQPPLVAELEKDLLCFLGGRGALLPCVVWAVGEFLSVSWTRRCTAELISRFFEALEALLFEVTQARPPAASWCPPELVTALMTALAKLASRSQDLIPRVSLSLSKMRSLALSGVAGMEEAAIGSRATELLQLLKMPGAAQLVLTPSPQAAHLRYHRDTNTALPLALHTVRRLLDREAGLVPG